MEEGSILAPVLGWSLSGNALFDRLHKAINSHAECLIPAASMQTLGSQKPVISAWKSTHGYF